MLNRLTAHWVYGGLVAGVLLLLLTPVLTAHWPALLVATYLHLPADMIHQFEEHDQDRFRLFFNQTIGKGHDVLSPMAVFITNVPGVWGVLAASLYAAKSETRGSASNALMTAFAALLSPTERGQEGRPSNTQVLSVSSSSPASKQPRVLLFS
ncbi:MAG: hypothetical protein ACKO1L_00805 [Brachymonas sp.]